MAKLAAIITAYNRADFVDKCVRSVLAAAHDSLAVHAWVMDNGSSDNTKEAAEAAGGEVTVLRTEDNRHIVEVINRGFQAVYEDPDVDMIIMMNEDTEFTPGSLNRLVEACQAHPDSLLTPMQLNYRAPEHLDDNAYEHIQTVRPLLEDALLGRPMRQVYSLPTIIGAAMLARRAVWESLGEFDPLFWFYGIDDDMCTRARWLGYATYLVPASHLYHAHGKLGGQAQAPSKEAQFRKWRNELQARYLFHLKDPGKSLADCLRETRWYALATAFECLRAPWPKGAWEAWRIYRDCVGNVERLNETRQRHFDPARKVDAPAEEEHNE